MRTITETQGAFYDAALDLERTFRSVRETPEYAKDPRCVVWRERFTSAVHRLMAAYDSLAPEEKQ